jgi:hypothetical protein
MKKFILSVTLTTTLFTAFSQSERYMKAMQDKVVAVDTTRTPDALLELSASFERIANAEKTQWLPYYYAALAQVNAGQAMTQGTMGGMKDKLDPVADKAEQLLSQAEALSKDNSEIYIVKKMIARLRLMADPMSRYMQYGPIGQQALDAATKLNPNNPRVYLMQAEDKYFTPEQYGGSKTEAKQLFEESLKKYDTFKPATSIDPNWGRGTAQYFLSQMK